MPAPLSMSRATIKTPDAEFDNVSIVVRVGKATVRSGRGIVATADVVRVEQQSKSTWLLTLADDSQWTVIRSKNCGCGG